MMEFYREALARFEEVFARASKTERSEPAAVILATADGAGRPSARTRAPQGRGRARVRVLHQRQQPQGAGAPGEPSGVARLLSWQSVFEQVQVEGPVEPVSGEESDAYWATRRRESCLGAWASDQSAPLASRGELDARYAEHERRFAGTEVPRPPHWRGYRVVPERIEFWRPGDHRLNERECYERTDAGWRRFLLNP